MNRQYAATEVLARENDDLAIDYAIRRLKSRLNDAPADVLNDVLQRCDPDRHVDLIGWIANRSKSTGCRRVPRDWSPKKNKKLWILYAAADLDRPDNPPRN